MNILGIDYGGTRVGLAIADDKVKIATPYEILKNEGENLLLAKLKKIIADEEIGLVVLGLPLTLKNKTSAQTEVVLNFQKILQRQIAVPVILADEKLTSHYAQGLMRERAVKEQDDVAAMLILQDYLATNL